MSEVEVSSPASRARQKFSPKRVTGAFRAVFGQQGPQHSIVWSVLADAAYATETSFDADPHVMAWREGKRALLLQIMDYAGITDRELREMMAYTGRLEGD